MLLFALCLDPFLRMLDETLKGHRTTHHSRRQAVIAYADDVPIILQSPQEVPLVQEAIGVYEAVYGASLNFEKSKAMALGSWNTTNIVMGLDYHNELRILGIHFATTTRQSAIRSWTHVTGNVRAEAHEMYHRDLQLHHRIKYVKTYLMAKAWYTAQNFPPPEDSVRQINTAVSWFIWHGEIFRVPLSTLYKPKERGGWALTHIDAKCRTLLLHRLQTLGKIKGSPTECWLKHWGLLRTSKNPPNQNRIPAGLDYLRRMEVDSSYVTPQGSTESPKKYRKRIYDVMVTILKTERTMKEMRVEKVWPGTNWNRVWKTYGLFRCRMT
jgi:hypothetical protein